VSISKTYRQAELKINNIEVMPKLTIKISYIENFLKIVELGSFTKAADKLNISQSAISQQIEALEKYFSAKLFIRSNKGVFLTEEGKILLKRAKPIIDNLNLAKAEINERLEGLGGILKISSSTVPGEHILPIYFTQFKKEKPNVKFQVEINDTATSFNKLINKEVDLAAVGSLLKYDDIVEYIILAEEELVFIVSTDHDLAKKKSITIYDIIKYPYIARESTSGTRYESERILESMGVPIEKMKIFCELSSTESILTAVSEGIGFSLISSIAAQKMEAAGLIKILPFPKKVPNKRTLYLVRLKELDLLDNKLLSSFWEFAKSFKFERK